MVTKELITELEKARDLFEWALLSGDAPVVERRKNPRLRVRGSCNSGRVPGSSPDLTGLD